MIKTIDGKPVVPVKPEHKIADLTTLSVKPTSLWKDAWFRLVRNKASVIGMIVIFIFTVVALFANVVAPHNPLLIVSGQKFLPPVWIAEGPNGALPNSDYLLGTDTLGRDVLSRVIYGARTSMMVGLLPTLMIVFIGVFVGLLAGYHGGRIDNLLMRFTDVVYAFPDLLFFIIVMVTLRQTFVGQLMNGLFMLFGALAIVNWVGFARIVRGQVLSLKEKEFIEAARCIGASDTRIMYKHLLPNSLGPVIILIAMAVPGMIITEAILGYLGLGLIPSTDPADFFITSWGALMLEGQTAINAQPWLLLSPAICVSMIVLAFTFLGDGLRDALDPKLQGTQ
ncbi:MAG: ABC transporter permease [Chloroflexi bacterium HGW-Chloroflexi-10]|nr:MAG: ABC transporter permease [Chloroflexi bacterium HGW-Chloroflexi-10]